MNREGEEVHRCRECGLQLSDDSKYFDYFSHMDASEISESQSDRFSCSDCFDRSFTQPLPVFGCWRSFTDGRLVYQGAWNHNLEYGGGVFSENSK